jgi:ribonuclease HI
MEATFKGIPIPTWGTHDLWGSDFDKNQAMARAVDAGTAPPTVLDMASRKCAVSASKFHHPDCETMRPGDEEDTHTNTTLTYWRSGKPKKRHKQCMGCKTLWTEEDIVIFRLIHATICTDGSTFTGKPSAAAFVYMVDGIEERDLWNTPGYYWTIEHTDNYMAELAALHKGLRSVPANVNLTAHTDSLSAIQAIEAASRDPERMNPIRCAGRPYILAILTAIKVRAKHKGSTTIKHVRSHTGGRDRPSIGNAEADRLAKWEASLPDKANNSLNLLQNELPYTLSKTKWTPPTDAIPAQETRTTIHGDIRNEARKHLADIHLQDWGNPTKRPTRGEVARLHPAQTKEAITSMWATAPSSTGIHMALTTLHKVTEKMPDPTSSKFIPSPCGRCGTKAPATYIHLTQTCPCNTHILNTLDTTLDEITRYTHDEEDIQTTSFIPTAQGPTPTGIINIAENNRRTLCNAIHQDNTRLVKREEIGRAHV